MGASVEPEKVYSPDNPFAKPQSQYSPDNPFAGTKPRTPKIGQHGIPISDESPEEPSYATKVLGGLASFGRDIPGVEAVQAMSGMKGLDLTKASDRSQFGDAYKTSLNSLRAAEDAAPKVVRVGNSIAGGTIAALAAPKAPFGTGGSAAAQGLRFGAAQGLLSADPVSAGERLWKGVKGGAIGGAVAGLVGDVAPKVARVIRAKSLGANALDRAAQMHDSDEAAYGLALASGKGASDPDLTTALESPGIKGYANAARKSLHLQGADDATIAHETYKRIVSRQMQLETGMEKAANYKAGSDSEIQDLELMKQRLLAGIDRIMPGYREAVANHAALAGQSDAFENAADQTRRVITNASAAGKNLDKNTPEAFKAQIIKLDKEKAAAAREAVLGRIQEQAGEKLNGNPLKGWGTNPFGLRNAASVINRASPYLKQLDEKIAPNSGVLSKGLSVGLGAQFSK